MKPTPPLRYLAGLACLILGLAAPTNRAFADPIADGRAALKAKNLNAANNAFQQAVAATPSDPEANVLAALSSLAMLETMPEAQALLSKLGVQANGRSIFHWTADAPKHFKSKATTDDFETYAKVKVLPALVAADAKLAKANSPGFQTTLAMDETGVMDVTLDLGDVLFIRSLIYTLTSSIHLTGTYNTSFKLEDISAWLPTNAMTLQKLFVTYPKLLTVNDAGELTSAVAAFGQAVGLYLSASDFMRARVDSTGRLFVIDPEYASVEAKSRAEVAAVKASLAGLTQLDTRTNVFAGAASTTAVSARALLPQYTFNHPTPGTLPDPHFSRVLPDMSTGRVEDYFQKVGDRLDHLFKHRDDPVNPTLVIKSPKPNARVPFQGQEIVTVTGTARDNVGVTRVVLTPQVGAPVLATLTPASKGTVNWTANVPVVPGQNAVEAMAFDHQGNFSKPTWLGFTFVELADAHLVISGSGTISPKLPKGNKLELGKLYSFSATPAAGYIFEGWTLDLGDRGTIFVGDRKLRYSFDSGATITATFIPSPYLQFAGGFNGVLQTFSQDTASNDTITVNHGLITLKFNQSGSFTGKVNYDGVAYPFKGKFMMSGFFGAADLRLKHGHDPALNLHLYISNDFFTGQPSLSAEVSTDDDPDNYAFADGDGGKVTGLATHYTVNIDSPSDDSVPGPANLNGHGYLALTTGKNGSVRGVGALADGSKISFSSSALPESNIFGNVGIGNAKAIISFFATAGARGANIAGALEIYAPDDILPVFGDVHWSHPRQPVSAMFSEAFEVDLIAVGSEFHPPARKQFLSPFQDPPHRGYLSVGSSSVLVDEVFTLNAASHVTLDLPIPQRLTLKIDPTTGLFSGSYIDTSGNHPVQCRFGGVIRQDQSVIFVGDGFSLDAAGSEVVGIDRF